MKLIIAWKKLWNYDSKLNKLTDYVVKNYIANARFCGIISIILEKDHHLEEYHRQLNATIRTNPHLWTWRNHQKSLL